MTDTEKYNNLSFHKTTLGDAGLPDEVASWDGGFDEDHVITAHHPEHGIVGKLVYRDMDHPEWTGFPPRALHIAMLRVHPDHRRRGVATQLMKHLEDTHRDIPIDHGTRTRMGEAWGRAMYGRASAPGRATAWDPETNKEEPIHYEADWTLNGRPWNIKTKKFLRKPKMAALEEPHWRDQLIAHAEGKQDLYKPNDQAMYGPGVCGYHANEADRQRQTSFRDVGIDRPELEQPKPETRWLSAGKGSCSACTGNQNRWVQQLPGMALAPMDGPQTSPERRPRERGPLHPQRQVPFRPDLFRGLPESLRSMNSKTASEDYWMRHRPGGPEEGTAAPAHAVDRVFPDYYEKPYLYDHSQGLEGGAQMGREVTQTLRRIRGNPEAPVTMYRSLPPEHADKGFRTGDWVSIHPAYARQHGMHESDPSKDWPVIKATVPAKHLWNNGDMIDEFGYHGPPIAGERHTFGKVGRNEVQAQSWDGTARREGSRASSEVLPQGVEEDSEGGESPQASAREVAFHPAVKRDLRRLDPQIARAAVNTIQAMTEGRFHGSQHPLNGPLNGWHASGVKGFYSHRITYRAIPNGPIEIGHVGPHNYDEAVRRLGSFTPTKRVFTNTCGLDHRLWEPNGKLKADVRKWIMGTIRDMWNPLYRDWAKWSIVYFAGSEASEWTSPELEGNNDFDVLVGVDYDKFRECNPTFDHMSNQEITDMLNKGFRSHNGTVMLKIDGKMTGPWDRTTYVNPESYDIRKIKPYAAYDVSNDKWVVKPPHLPHWSLSKFPKSVQNVLRAASDYADDVLALPEPERTQQGAALFDAWHSDRSRAFGPEGEGWWDIANLREKWLDQKGTWAEIVDCKHRANEGLAAAPADWSNMPKFASLPIDTPHYAGVHPYAQRDWYHGGTLDGGRTLYDKIDRSGHGVFHVGDKDAALDRIDPKKWDSTPGEFPHVPHSRLYRLRLAPGARVCPHIHDDDEDAGSLDFRLHDPDKYDVHAYRNKYEGKPGEVSLVGKSHVFRVEEDLGRHPNWQDPEVQREWHRLAKTASATTDALDEIGRQEHPNVDHYQSGGMGHLEGDETHSVVGFMPVHALKPFREHNGDWNGEHSAEVREKLSKDIDEGKGFHTPLMVEYNPDLNWGYLGEGNHRLRVAEDKGLRTVPVRVVRSYGRVEEKKRQGIGAPMHLHSSFGPGYTPSDIHPHHFLKQATTIAPAPPQNRHWGKGLNSLFPADEDGPSPVAQVPLPQAQQSKAKHLYDKDLVARSITHPDEFPIEEVDPRSLRATQPKVLRAGVKHYMEHGTDGPTYGSQNGNDNRLGNDMPRIYRHLDTGEDIVLTGHHRAISQLLKGEPLKARIVRGGWGPDRA